MEAFQKRGRKSFLDSVGGALLEVHRVQDRFSTNVDRVAHKLRLFEGTDWWWGGLTRYIYLSHRVFFVLVK